MRFPVAVTPDLSSITFDEDSHFSLLLLWLLLLVCGFVGWFVGWFDQTQNTHAHSASFIALHARLGDAVMYSTRCMYTTICDT